MTLTMILLIEICSAKTDFFSFSPHFLVGALLFGAVMQNRTADLRVTNPLLYQLSYSGINFNNKNYTQKNIVYQGILY